MTDREQSSFEQAASDTRDVGFLGELWGLIRSTRKWWLLPILPVLVMFSVLIILSGTGLAPFVYTLF